MANKELMITLGLDASSYSQNVKRAKDLNKELDSSFKLMASSSEKFENSINGLGKKQDYLSQKIKIATGLTEVYADRLKESQDALEKSQKEAELYGNSVTKLERQLKAIGSALGENSDAYKKIEKELKANIQLQDKAEKAIAQYNRRILEAKTGYNETQASIQRFNREIEFTSQKLDALEGDNAIKALSNDIDDLDHSFDLVKNSVSNFDSTMEGLSKTQDYYNQKTKLNNELLSKYRQEIDTSTELLDLYSNELKDVNSELEEWDSLLRDMKGNEPDYESIRSEVENLRLEYTQINQIVEFHQDRVDSLGSQYKNTEKDLAKLAGGLDSTVKKMQSMNDKITFKPVSEEIKQLTNESIKKLEAEMEKLDNEFDILTNSVDNYENSITGLTQKQKYYAESLDLAKKAFNEYNKELVESKSKVEELSEKQKKLETEIKSYISELKNLDGAEWDKQVKSINKLKEEYEDVNKDLSLHTNRLKEVDKGYKESAQNVAKLTNEFKKTQTQLNEFSKKKYFDGLDNSIKSISEKMQLLESKFKVTESAVKNFGKTKDDLAKKTEFYTQKLGALEDKLEAYQNSIKATESELKRLENEQTQAAQKAEELRKKLSESEKDSPDYNKTIIALTQVEAEMEDLENQIRTTADKFNSLQVELNETTAETNELRRATNNLNSEFMQTKFETLGDNLTNFGSGLQQAGQATLGVTMAVGALGAGVIKTGTDFSTAMSEVRAVTGATEEDFKKLEDTARRLGEETVYSATECAEGLKYLGLAGYSAQESMESLPYILSLAQSGALELSEASDLATDAISSLGYVGSEAVKELPDYLNKVARASTRSNTSIEQMLQAYIKVGGQLDTMNISLDTSASMLGILANRGIKAEASGNSLNSILINLTKESGESAEAMQYLSERLGYTSNLMFDAEGNMRNIEDCFIDMSRAMQGLTQQEKINIINMIGGKTQAKTLQKLLQGMITDTGELTEEYKSLKAEIEQAPNTNALEEMASTMTDNLGGDIKILLSTIQETFLSVFESLEPQLREIVQKITSVVKTLADRFKEMSPDMQMFVVEMAGLLAIIPPLLILFGAMSSGLGALSNIFSKVIKATGLFGKTAEGTVTIGSLLGKSFTILGTTITGATAAIAAGIAALVAIITVIGENENALAWLQEKWGAFGTFIGGICETISGVVQSAFRPILKIIQLLGESIGAILSGNWRDLDDIWREGWAELKIITAEGASDIAMESTRGIAKIREASEEELNAVTTLFDESLATLPNITKDNLKQTAKVFSEKIQGITDDTLLMARGTSETMAVLFNGIEEGMDAKKMEKTIKKNMDTLLQAGKLSASELQSEFDKANDLISKNMKTSFNRAKDEADTIIKEIERTSVKGVNGVAISLSSLVKSMDENTLSTLRSMGGEWDKVLSDLDNTADMTTQEIANTILNNLNKLGVDTPEGVNALTQNLRDNFGNLSLEIEEVVEQTSKNIEEITANTNESVNAILATLGSGGEVTRQMAEVVTTHVENMGADVAKELSNSSDEWYSLLHGAFDESGNLSKDFADTVLGNLNYLSIDTPEELALFVDKLQEGLDNANIVAEEESSKLTDTIVDSTSDMKTGVSESSEEFVEAVFPIQEKMSELGDIISEKFTQIKEKTSESVDSIKEKTSELGKKISEGFSDMGKAIEDKYNDVVKYFKELPKKATEGYENLKEKAGQAIESMIETTKEKIREIPSLLKQSLIDWSKDVETFFSEFGAKAGTLVGTIIGVLVGIGATIKNVFLDVIDIISSSFKIISGLMTGEFGLIKEGVLGVFTGIFNIIKDTLIGVWNVVSGTLENIASIFDIDLSGITSAIETWCSDAYTSFTNWCTESKEKFSEWFTNLKTNFPIWLGELKNNFLNWITETKENFEQWKNDMIEKTRQWASETIEKTKQGLKDWVNKHIESLAEAQNKWDNWKKEMLNKLVTWFNDWKAKTKEQLSQWSKNFSNACDEVVGFFKSLPSKLYSIGQDMISNLWSGFQSMLSNFKNNVSGAINGILNKFRTVDVEADVAYSNRETPSISRSSESEDMNPVTSISFGRSGFADVGKIFEDIFRSSFKLDNYKTNGGFYEAKSMNTSAQKNVPNNDSLINALIQQNKLLMQILTESRPIEVGVNVDGRQVAKASAKYIQSELNTMNQRKLRLGGKN